MELAALAANAGPGALAVILAVVIWRQASADRRSYSDSLAAAEERHAAELDRIVEARDRELGELRQRIDALAERVDDLTRELDAERRRRWRAEDVAAEARRPVGGG